MTTTEGQTTTPSGADVDPLAVMDRDIIGAYYDWNEALKWRDKQRKAGCGPEAIGEAQFRADTLQAVWQRRTDARTAVAALIARNAELEAELARSPRDTPFGREAEKLADDYLCLRSHHVAMIEDRDALAAENKALREDAERYRFIRERFTQIVAETYQESGDWLKTVTRIDFRDSFSPPYPESVDAEIDAAIARTPANGASND